MTKTLLTFQNAKTSKGESLGYLTGILYIAPSTIVKGLNVCKFASKGCKESCLYSAGRGKFSNVQAARTRKAKLWRDDKDLFFRILIKDIKRAQRKANRDKLKLCIRLNGTSDIDFENYRCKGKNIFEIFPNIQFYDYTKNFTRLNALKGKWTNYHLTFSRSESVRNQSEALKLLHTGVNVAAVFKDVPMIYSNKEVINGDLHDLRFLDKRGVVVGLTAKGDAKKDTTGFVL